MAKIVYNACYGGFSLSEAGVRRYAEIKGLTLYPDDGKLGFKTYWTCSPSEREAHIVPEDKWYVTPLDERQKSNAFYRENVLSDRDIERDDPALIQVVEELGDGANGMCAKLRIEDLPSGTAYRIDEYDGFETVATNDSYEWKIAR